jgi:hypothetical protein
MKKSKFVLSVIAIIFIFVFKTNSFAQQYPVLYFCEKYGSNGEVGVSDRFTTGYLTVMVKADGPIGLRDCSIQLDKYDSNAEKFIFYKKFSYSVDPDMKYIFFEKNDESDMNFEDPGIYRVFLLNQNGSTIASGLVEIIP